MRAELKPNPLFNANRLKLATFCANNFTFPTVAPDLGLPSWDDMLRAAQLADAAGFEAIIPVARWKGYLDGAPDHPMNYVLDPFAYSAAMSQATQYSALFATTHAPTIHPVAIAKLAATIDLMSGGRFAMNIVGGWNRREFEMFGIELLDHDKRYAYLGEWLDVIRRLWTSEEELDYDSRYFRLKGALCRPQPLQPKVPVMNAGLSETGMRFAAAHADLALISIMGHDAEKWAKQVRDYKSLAREQFGKSLQVWTNIIMVQRETDKEAADYLDYYSNQHPDVAVLDSFVQTLSQETKLAPGSPELAFMRSTIAIGSGYPVIGSAETIARKLRTLSDCGLDGLMINWTDPADGITRLTRDVFPILEAEGLRSPFQPTL